MLEAISKSMFVETLHSHYQLHLSPTQTVTLELIEVREGRSTPRQEQFALLFQAPPEHVFWQGLWSVDHPTLGNMDLFLVPVGRDADGYYFEAVFNRLL